MDDNKRIRVALLVIGFTLAITPILLFVNYSRYMGHFEQDVIKNFGIFGGFASFVSFFAVFTITDHNRLSRKQAALKRAAQQREEEIKKQIAEHERQMELELASERQRKLELLKNYEIAGQYEAAAKLCDELQMWEKAGELRRMSKTSYLISTSFSMGKGGAISVSCPTCGSTQVVESKSNLVTCKHCGNNYIIPKKILDMM